MSDEFLTGQEATEAAHGHFPVHNDPPPDPVLTPTEAAEKLDRPELQPTVERDYIKVRDGEPVRARNEDGTFADGLFERESPQGWVTAEEAGRDLAAQRQAEAKLLKDQQDLEVQRAVDALRAEGFQTGQQPAQPQEDPLKTWGDQQATQETAAQAFERIKQQPGGPTNDDVRLVLGNALAELDASLATTTDPNLVAALQNQRGELQTKLNEATWAKAFERHPELVGMVEAEIANKVAAQTAQVQQYQQQLYAQEQQIAQIAVASLLSEPEFRGLNPQDIPAAMKIMQRDAPERAAQISARTQAAYQLVQQQQARAQETAKAQAEAQRANFLNWAHQQDLAFDRANPGVTQELKDETMQMLRDTGLKDSDIAQLYNSAPWFRNAATQALLKDAAEARLARKSLREHRAAPPPAKVMRPGSGSDVDLRREYEAAPRLPSEFANAKEAAAFITKVRAARR